VEFRGPKIQVPGFSGSAFRVEDTRARWKRLLPYGSARPSFAPTMKSGWRLFPMRAVSGPPACLEEAAAELAALPADEARIDRGADAAGPGFCRLSSSGSCCNGRRRAGRAPAGGSRLVDHVGLLPPVASTPWRAPKHPARRRKSVIGGARHPVQSRLLRLPARRPHRGTPPRWIGPLRSTRVSGSKPRPTTTSRRFAPLATPRETDETRAADRRPATRLPIRRSGRPIVVLIGRARLPWRNWCDPTYV